MPRKLLPRSTYCLANPEEPLMAATYNCHTNGIAYSGLVLHKSGWRDSIRIELTEQELRELQRALSEGEQE